MVEPKPPVRPETGHRVVVVPLLPGSRPRYDDETDVSIFYFSSGDPDRDGTGFCAVAGKYTEYPSDLLVLEYQGRATGRYPVWEIVENNE